MSKFSADRESSGRQLRPKGARALLLSSRQAVVVAVAAIASVAFAIGLSVVDDAATGQTILTDDQGRALYMSLEDEREVSNCDANCELNWVPLLVEGETALAEAIDPELVGSITRPDGSEQVTYNGWPLYRFARDFNPNVRLGQGLNDVWFLMTVTGEPAGAPEGATDAVELSQEEIATLMSTGQQVFGQFCVACHGNAGQGGTGGPQLAGNANLASATRVVNQIINGGSDMPAFGTFLDDLQVASVATYVRRSWGNDFPAISAEEVSQQR